MPGDPTAAFLDASATPEQVARLRAQLGLDKPLPLQMVDWYGRMLRGDLGQSILLNRSVTAAIVERLPVTLSLAGLALVIRRHARRRGRHGRGGQPQPLAGSGRDDDSRCSACRCRISGSASC